jgi:GT2 family glycosyltransferase
LGFGRANNIGMRYALSKGCNYVFLLNQDTWIENDAIEKLVRIHQQHPEFGILSPMHVRADGKSLYIQIEDGSRDHGNKMLSDFYFQTIDDVYKVSYVNAAAWLLPLDTLMSIGGFDPMFTHYSEDDDYINRVMYHGIMIGLCPNCRIVHDHQKVDNPLTPIGSRKRRDQQTLLHLTNINQTESINAYLFYIIRKMIRMLLKGDHIRLKEYYNDFRFIQKRKKEITQNKTLKKEKQPLWLK